MKYPSTPYFNNSPSIDVLDARKTPVDSISMLNTPLLFTIKMDGSNVSITNNNVAARNGIDARHKSFDPLKAKNIQYCVPESYILFGEWLFAQHSISYTELEDYLMIFNIFDTETNTFLDWDKVKKFCKSNNLTTVPTVTTDQFNSVDTLFKTVETLGNKVISNGHEGIVVRKYTEFRLSEFEHSVGKYVRRNHVQTDRHWKFKPIHKNILSFSI